MSSTNGQGKQVVVAAPAAVTVLGDRLDAVATSVRSLASIEVERLDGAPLQTLLAQLPRLIRQLEGVRARAGATAQRAEIRKRPSEDVGRVLTDHQQQLGRQQRLSPTDTKRALDAGRAAADHPRTGAALRDGDLDNAHAQLIARILADIPLDRHEVVETELLELARHLDPVAFGRRARQILGREQAPALAHDERRQHARRRLRAADTDDGGLAISGAFYGVAAEHVRVALRAFRRPDTSDEHRSTDQRGADAFEQLCVAALRSGEAPTEHGVRPQVIVTLSASELAALEGRPTEVTGTLLHSGQTVSGRELRSIVADAQLVRLVLAADRTPLEVSSKVRTVPVGLWRALLVRDGGCVWPGCDAPASWCDVAHGADAYEDDGNLSPDNAMLLCRRHHRTFDAGSRAVRIEGDTVTFPDLERAGAQRATGPIAGRSDQNPSPWTLDLDRPEAAGPHTTHAASTRVVTVRVPTELAVAEPAASEPAVGGSALRSGSRRTASAIPHGPPPAVRDRPARWHVAPPPEPNHGPYPVAATSGLPIAHRARFSGSIRRGWRRKPGPMRSRGPPPAGAPPTSTAPTRVASGAEHGALYTYPRGQRRRARRPVLLPA